MFKLHNLVCFILHIAMIWYYYFYKNIKIIIEIKQVLSLLEISIN